MYERTEMRPSIYPIYLLDPSDTNGQPASLTTTLDLGLRLQAMLRNATFLHIKRFILPPAEHPDNKYHKLASPLVTWIYQHPDRIAEMMDAGIDEGIITEHQRALPPNFKYIAHRTTLLDGRIAGEDGTVAYMTSWTGQPCPQLLESALAAVCRFFTNTHYDNIHPNPGKVIRIPLSELRVRDIVLYRYFKEMLAKADMSDIKVRTDNVQRPNSKEAVNEPIYTFCANCLKVELSHERCSGCKVAFFCTLECQKKGWNLHKTECIERQKEQVEWDAIVASFNE